MTVKPVPDGFHSLTPYLVVRGAAHAIDFYRKAFGAEELFRNTCDASGLVLNAQLRIGDSMLMLNDEIPGFGGQAPAREHPPSVTIHLYVEDADAVHERAVQAGATSDMPVSDTFWGDRYGKLTDPFGHSWSIATRKENLSPDEIAERARTAFA